MSQLECWALRGAAQVAAKQIGNRFDKLIALEREETMSDIVERLRDKRHLRDKNIWRPTAQEAADTIERLQAEVERLKGEVERLTEL
ncbi:MAG TPA: hypothetical protein VKA31_11430 [Mariprofundaceae bacterium]|nr:hypothetical protein [Mariprofundaceae bacterium]